MLQESYKLPLQTEMFSYGLAQLVATAAPFCRGLFQLDVSRAHGTKAVPWLRAQGQINRGYPLEAARAEVDSGQCVRKMRPENVQKMRILRWLFRQIWVKNGHFLARKSWKKAAFCVPEAKLAVKEWFSSQIRTICLLRRPPKNHPQGQLER